MKKFTFILAIAIVTVFIMPSCNDSSYEEVETEVTIFDDESTVGGDPSKDKPELP